MEHSMREKGSIIGLAGEMAEVVIGRHASCESCQACGFGGKQQISFRVKNEIGAKMGDWVEIELQTGKLYQAAFLMYTLPMVMLFIGYYGLRSLGKNIGIHPAYAENVGIGGAFAVMALTYWAIRFWDRKRQIGLKFQPKLVAIITPEESSSEEQ
jgi:sigma-E factor negative regulatory protein RseC